MKEVIKEFIAESHEGMDRMEHDLLAFEKDPASRGEVLQRIFRVVHSIKGACGFLGFGKLENLAHAGENLLSGLQEGKLRPEVPMITCLFRMEDAIRILLGTIESTNAEGDADFSDLTREMLKLAAGPDAGDWVAESAREPLLPAGPLQDEKEAAASEAVQEALAAREQAESRRIGEQPADRSIRVDVGLLDKLMNLVGELVLVRNQVLQWTLQSGDGRLTAAAQQLNLLTTELQEGVVKTRMQPIKNVWSKFPRLVRELSIACGKQVRVEIEGEETELDKGVLEAIKDPLTHVLRNSVDHGIESPQARSAAGKAPEGRILLKAYQKDGQVIIEIADDGGGIDCQRVARKALEKGLVSPEGIARMDDSELARLIFLPGFSTAEKVTNLSGRGVGMDVVKTNVEKIGGSIELANQPGKGLVMRIRIPLTLAIIPALIVQARGQRFAVPQINVVEIVRLKEASPGRGVEWIQGSPIYRLRGKLLPLVRLGLHLGLEQALAPDRLLDEERFIAVLQNDSQQFGMLVHAVQDTQEILVKPLNRHLKGIPIFAGATIMGDGRAVLILDAPGLAQSCRLCREAAEAQEEETRSVEAGRGDSRRLLVVEIAAYGLAAIPLEQVARLEEIPAGSLERMGRMEVVQSRGRIMPILRADRLLSMQAGDPDPREGGSPEQNLHVVACAEGDVVVGVVVDQVVDIVDESVEVMLPAMMPGMIGSAIIKGKAMELLDLREFVRLSLPRLAGAGEEPGA